MSNKRLILTQGSSNTDISRNGPRYSAVALLYICVIYLFVYCLFLFVYGLFIYCLFVCLLFVFVCLWFVCLLFVCLLFRVPLEIIRHHHRWRAVKRPSLSHIAFQHGGIFIVLHLMWHEAFGFVASFEGPTNLTKVRPLFTLSHKYAIA